MLRLLFYLGMMFSFLACDQAPTAPKKGALKSTPDSTENVLSLEIVGWSFVGPNEIKSGWTTIRINNDSGMTHHGLVYRLPDGVTAEMVSDQVIKPLQEGLTASLNGDLTKAAEIMNTIPTWINDIVYLGGPGMMSNNVVGEATMFLEPGNYIVECYVKTNGVQHNYNPEPGAHGMVLPLTVKTEPGGMSEPEANVTLEITNSGYEVTEGEFEEGENSVRIKFVEQRLYNNFVGHDAHFFKITPEIDIEAATKWVDFFPLDGQQTPAPAHFVGGIHDMPEGSTAYFKLMLAEGEYGIVAEVPNARDIGLFDTFTVKSD
jgi:hypothetical protein